MTYRDDLGAAQARIRQLEEELQDSRQTVDDLKQALADKERPKPPKPQKPKKRPLRKLGKIVFKAPPRYFPLFKLLTRSASVAFRLPPQIPPLESKVFAVWLAYKLLLWPLIALIMRPLFYVFLVFPVLPVTALFITVASVVAVPFIFSSRFQFSDGNTDPFRDPAWLRGEFTDGQASTFLWILLSCCMQPLLPFYYRLLGHSDDN